MTLSEEMRRKRREWTRAIEKTKATHWKEFLDSTGEGLLWKASTYLGQRGAYASIPPLKACLEEIPDNTNKARILMESFFPEMGGAEEEVIVPEREEIPWEPITEQEVQKALMAAKRKTAPGEDVYIPCTHFSTVTWTITAAY